MGLRTVHANNAYAAAMHPEPARRRGLNLDEIVTAAIAIADEDGLGAVSMRRVADRLGRPVMSLYRHVEDKDRLLAFATDAVFAEEAFPGDVPAAWRPRLLESTRRQWRCYLRHPWLASVISLVRPSLGPNGMSEMEWAFEGLRDLHISDPEKVQMYLVLAAYVHGAAGQFATEDRDRRQSGLAPQQWWGEQAALLGEIFASGRYPNISRLRGGLKPTPEDWFEFGLESLLNGLALRLPPKT